VVVDVGRTGTSGAGGPFAQHRRAVAARPAVSAAVPAKRSLATKRRS